MLSDLDYSEYLETPSVTVMIRDMIDTAMMRYTSVLILQPFKVAKTVMQCQYVPRQPSGKAGERVAGTGSRSRRSSEVSPGFAEYGGEWGGQANVRNECSLS
jgi:fusion and transport protein UGO1